MSEKEIFDFIHKQVNALSPLLFECDKQKLQESKRLFDTFVSTLSEQTREQATQKTFLQSLFAPFAARVIRLKPPY